MLKSLVILFLCLFTGALANAQYKTEAQLLDRLLTCIKDNDSKCFQQLFPSTDSLAQWVVQYGDSSSAVFNRMLYARDNPELLMQFQKEITERSSQNFNDFIEKAKAVGLHVNQIIFARYELKRVSPKKGLISEKIAPLRFLGYVFVKDLLTRKMYGFTLTDMMEVNGRWYGGELTNVFPAMSKEDYEKELIAERKRLRDQRLGIRRDTAAIAQEPLSGDGEEEKDKPSNMKEVIERKFYKGKFDNEIEVQLYVRHIKGSCPQVTCSWEALFKFGDDEYVKMQVNKTPAGKWMFSEEVGGMELTLVGDVYSGTWISGTDKTEYEAVFKEVPATNKRLFMLDEILEKELYDK
jgi:hypothetical protein